MKKAIGMLAAALTLWAAPKIQAAPEGAGPPPDYPAAQCPDGPRGEHASCIGSYVGAANGEIKRLQDAAAAQIRQTMQMADARIKQIRKQSPLPDTAAAEIKRIQAQENEGLEQIGDAASDRIERINARIRLATGELPAPAAAPKPTPALESVTVTAAKPSAEAITGFILSHGAGTRLTGKLARWKMGVCPRVEGLTPEDAAYVVQRIRDVAARVGAPVNTDPACRTNIRIAFTPAPQDFLDAMRREHRGALDYADNLRQAARLSTVTHAVQAWYTTATEDLRGHRELDTPRPVTGVTMEMPAYFASATGGNALAQGSITLNLPSASMKAVSGNRLGDGLSSEFDHILIVAEPARLKDVESRSLADYIALLALSQPDALDRCETLPSIINLLAPACQSQAVTITDGDVAYLHGLYKMTTTASLPVQRDEVRYQMEQALKKD